MKLYATILSTLLTTASYGQNKMVPQEILTKITSEFSKQKGTFALAFKDLSTEQMILINGGESFHAASTMKTPLMIEVYKQVASGKFSLSDSLFIKNEFKSIVDSSTYSLNPEDDSEKGLYDRVGKKTTLSRLLYDMIIMSSNLATNIIIELLDPKTVTASMHELGARNMNVLRGVEDAKAFDKGLINTTSAYDLLVIYEKLAKGLIINDNASGEMIKILLDQRFNEIIPALLPKDVRVAHKTGSITGVQHDGGIVFLPGGKKYVLVFLSKDLADEKAAIETMARISEILYNYVKTTAVSP